jgi:phosphoribosylformylglycinamidine synthase
VDLDFKMLRKGCPLPEISLEKLQKKRDSFTPPPLKSADDWKQAVNKILGHLNLCDQSRAGAQFDSTIQGATVSGPYGGKGYRMPNDIWAGAPLRGKPFGAVASIGFNPLYGDVDPPGAAKLAIVESVGKLVTAGVSPDDIVLCDNFYTPRVNPEVAHSLKSMVNTCCDLTERLGTPFISGKDSSSGTFIGEDGQRIDIPPTLAVMAMGRIRDVRLLIPKPWQQPGNLLFIGGPVSLNLGGSVYLDTSGKRGDALPDPDIDELVAFWKQLGHHQMEGHILSASAIAAGGLICRLFEMAVGSGLGCRINLTDLAGQLDAKLPEHVLFAEMIGAVVIEAHPSNRKALEEDLGAICIGEIQPDPVIHLDAENPLSFEMKDLIQVWEAPFKEIS